MYVQSPHHTELLKSQSSIARSLIRGCSQFNILEPGAPAPSGCSLYTLEDTKIYLLVKGMVDIEQELKKLQGKHDKISKLHDAIVTRQAVDGYALNVKDEIKTLDSNKVLIF